MSGSAYSFGTGGDGRASRWAVSLRIPQRGIKVAGTVNYWHILPGDVSDNQPLIQQVAGH